MVHVVGVVTIAPGGLGSLSLIAVQDESGGIVVRLPSPTNLAVGTRIDVTGRVAAPYGQQEVRPAAGGWTATGEAAVPSPRTVTGALDEDLEGLLVVVEGTLSAGPTKGSNGDTSSTLDVDGAPLNIRTDGTSGVGADRLVRGARYRLVGVVGQRASASGRDDGYRIWIRTPDDVEFLEAAPSPSASPSPSGPTASKKPKPSPKSTPTRVGDAAAEHDRARHHGRRHRPCRRRRDRRRRACSTATTARS